MIGAYDPSIGQNIKTDAEKKNVDMSFLAHFQVSADHATVTNDTYIVSYVNMTDAEQEIEEDFAVPTVPRNNTVLKAYLGNTLEGTAPTVTTDVDEIEKNTVDLNSALNSSVVDVYLIV